MDAQNSAAPKTAAKNGVLWGNRASDWAEIQEGQVRAAYDAVFRAVGLKAGMNYCDVGCGAGMAAELAAAQGAKVSGLDASEALLAIARRRVPGGDFRVGEMESLPFADHAFEVVTGFNSFQYAGSPAIALAEARRVTGPGGKVVVMTWGLPETMEASAVVTALKSLLPPPPPGAPGPFALSKESDLRAFVESAGLRVIAVNDVASPWIYPDLPTALRGLGSSGVAARARDQSGDAAVDRAHGEAIAPFKQPDGSYRLTATFRWLAASP